MSTNLANLLYLIPIASFILALRFLSNPAHARRGNQIGAVGMLVAIVVTWIKTGSTSWWAIAAGMLIGGGFGAVAARRVKMTAMPQMVALFNGVGGGAAALIALAELHRILPEPGRPKLDIGAAMAKDVRDKGGSLSLADLASYRAGIAEPLETPYRGGRVFAASGFFTGGPVITSCLRKLSEIAKPSYVDYARVLDEVWRARLNDAGDRDGCTTHFSVVDRHGNLCAVTQTNLSIFGSRVVSPATGVLLNNGIMWFDPEPGKANSLGPGKRCLGNYCPVIGQTPKGERFALGASGGRKIVGTVLQMSSFILDHGATFEEAFHRPRIDMSGGERVIADAALPADELQKLENAFPTVVARRLPFPYHFAVPAGVMRSGELNMGCTEIMSPWGDAVAELN